MKYILSIILLLIAATVYFIIRPQPEFEVGNVRISAESAEEMEEDEIDPQATMAAQRRAVMEAEFEKLKLARRNLESRLSRLKAIMWGKKISREEGDAINEQMKNGYALLKYQKLMGAYTDAEQISVELARIEFINNYLKEVEDGYRAERRQQ
ncbi:MAG: hypothetical protein A2993_01480 [Gammaproteobacteria bacterium RIFCSPLOWO2_01_FULL_47_190]|nr:MAG: hypothetical protein A2993_01480 [Gammaproteobacteria bacterium RIFCSPLOWO2_01_FULL_47_190]OGT76446.1 MAG: hypothetical protein A2W76_08150 [Gammaproteobacteria bacterium RIFCSPLOWO2_12_47_11]OGT88034.1 MAG: hypothetical protein A3G42_07120 [Gammaproteobacteria bacterium RIFCSPLOWO2_12_FULL_47_76]